jgi:hypothetical protein
MAFLRNSLKRLTFPSFVTRNLFLGYYVPYRHTVPLWEMETDYYLHNRYVDTGKGMRAYQESFGVLDWDCDDTDLGPKVDGTARPHAGSKAMVPEQSLKIQMVRDRCTSQNKALSNWWKVAVQRNVQQRMVRIGSSNSAMKSWSKTFPFSQRCCFG